MSLKKTGLIFSALFLLPPLVRAQTQTYDKVSGLYWVFKTVVLDIDQSLRNHGINIESCQYKRVTGVTKNYQGFAPCLFDRLFDSVKTQSVTQETLTSSLVNPIIADVRIGFSTEHTPVKIYWQQTHHGLWSFVDEILDLYFENIVSFFSNCKKIKDTRNDGNFIGRLNIVFPNGFNFEKLSKLNQALEQIGTVSDVDVLVSPDQEKACQFWYNGQIRILEEDKGDQARVNINFKTNIDAFRLKREFKLQSHIEFQ